MNLDIQIQFKRAKHILGTGLALSLASFALAHSEPVKSLAMAGYQEVPTSPDGSGDWMSINQDRYLRNKHELEKALARCAAKAASCNRRIAAFRKVSGHIRNIPDALSRARYVNAWVNLAIRYDDGESARLEHSHAHYRSLTQTLRDGKAICEEQAELKLFMLEKLLPQDDVRFVRVEEYVMGVHQDIGHAVILARIDGKNWVLNNQSQEMPDSLSRKEALEIVSDASFMETDSASLNHKQQSIYSTANEKYIPGASFNSSMRAYYDVEAKKFLMDIPLTPEAETDAADTAVMDLSENWDKEAGFFLPLMRPATKTVTQLAANQIR